MKQIKIFEYTIDEFNYKNIISIIEKELNSFLKKVSNSGVTSFLLGQAKIIFIIEYEAWEKLEKAILSPYIFYISVGNYFYTYCPPPLKKNSQNRFSNIIILLNWKEVEEVEQWESICETKLIYIGAPIYP